MKAKVMLIMITLLLFGAHARGADWYVDPAAAPGGNGKSWAGAWSAFSSIVWGPGGVKAGDTLFISGGPSGRVYRDFLEIGASGTAADPIRIRPGQDPGHNGQVIFDGGNSRPNLLRIYSKNYVHVDGNTGGKRSFIFRNAPDHGKFSLIDASSVTGVKILNCEVTGSPTGISMLFGTGCEVAGNYIHDIHWEAGIDMDGSFGDWDGNLVHDNHIQANVPADGSGEGADGIQCSSGISIYNNLIEGVAGGRVIAGQHPDGVQASGRFVRIHGNTIRDMPNACISGDYSEATEGLLWIFNNVCHYTNPAWNGYVRFLDYNVLPGVRVLDQIRVYNNTVVDVFGHQAIFFHIHSRGTRITDSAVVNNIFFNSGNRNAEVIRFDAGAYSCGTDLIIDNNLINAGTKGGRQIVCNGADYMQPNGYAGQPLFSRYSERSRDNSFSLAEGDRNARGRGLNLSSYFNLDREGKPRPASGAWSLGAYE